MFFHFYSRKFTIVPGIPPLNLVNASINLLKHEPVTPKSRVFEHILSVYLSAGPIKKHGRMC